MNFHKEWKLVFTLSMTERKKIVVKLKEIMAGFCGLFVVFFYKNYRSLEFFIA